MWLDVGKFEFSLEFATDTLPERLPAGLVSLLLLCSCFEARCLLLKTLRRSKKTE